MDSSLEPASGHGWRDVGRVEGTQKISGLSRTSRLVCVSATLYGDGVRRRCATRCPRPLVDLARPAVPPSAEAERWRRRTRPSPAIVGSLRVPSPVASSSFAVGGRPPTPPGARFARGCVVSLIRGGLNNCAG